VFALHSVHLATQGSGGSACTAPNAFLQLISRIALRGAPVLHGAPPIAVKLDASSAFDPQFIARKAALRTL
jgi:hypothetical protein